MVILFLNPLALESVAIWKGLTLELWAFGQKVEINVELPKEPVNVVSGFPSIPIDARRLLRPDVSFCAS